MNTKKSASFVSVVATAIVIATTKFVNEVVKAE
jgi:hypothetical protein